MVIIENILELDYKIDKSCVAIGSFDGVHLGHKKLIDDCIKKAKEINGKSVIFTFQNHPTDIFHSDRMPYLINTTEEKIFLLESLGVDYIILQKFDQSFADISPEGFAKILKEKLDVKEIFVGFNFNFGKGGEGRVEDLNLFCKKLDIHLNVIPPVTFESEIISSTLIRKYMLENDFNKVVKMLDHPLIVIGEVIHGKKIARTLGFPTANLKMSNRLYPPLGIYGATVRIEGEDFDRHAVINVGLNPTLKPGELSLEAHIFDFDKDIYGKKIRVELLKYLREERKFDDINDLIKTIEKDVNEWKDYIRENCYGNITKA